MKYENPELTALTPAINAIQGTGPNKGSTTQPLDSQFQNESTNGYADWES